MLMRYTLLFISSVIPSHISLLRIVVLIFLYNMYSHILYSYIHIMSSTCNILYLVKLYLHALYQTIISYDLYPRIKISINTDISVIGFYGNIGNIGKILVDIFTKISVIKIFYILII